MAPYNLRSDHLFGGRFLSEYLKKNSINLPPHPNSELEDIDSDVLLDLKIRTYSYLSKTMQLKKSELLLASLLKIHQDKCVDQLCTCKLRKYLYDPKKLEAGGQVD